MFLRRPRLMFPQRKNLQQCLLPCLSEQSIHFYQHFIETFWNGNVIWLRTSGAFLKCCIYFFYKQHMSALRDLCCTLMNFENISKYMIQPIKETWMTRYIITILHFYVFMFYDVKKSKKGHFVWCKWCSKIITAMMMKINNLTRNKVQ